MIQQYLIGIKWTHRSQIVWTNYLLAHHYVTRNASYGFIAIPNEPSYAVRLVTIDMTPTDMTALLLTCSGVTIYSSSDYAHPALCHFVHVSDCTNHQ